MKQSFFYLEHVNGGYMCLRPTGRGYTWSEPETDGIPRLFRTHGGAKQALRWWAAGPISNIKLPNNSTTLMKHNQQQRTPMDWEIKEVMI